MPMVSPKSESSHYYPEVLIEEILARLPIKSILRFKSTCKTWYSLIRSPSFIKFHTRLHQQDGDEEDEKDDNIIFFSTDEPFAISSLSIRLSFNEDLTPLLDLSSLQKALCPAAPAAVPLVVGPLENGVCCVVYREIDKYNLALCNLATKEFKLVNFTCTDSQFSQSQHHFGFSSIGDDYKIVVIQQNGNGGDQRASLYSAKRGKWNILMLDSDFPMITQSLNGYPQQALVNGCCHWMAVATESKSEEESRVVRFNMAEDVFSVEPGPPGEYYREKYHHHQFKGGVCVVDNRLAVVMLVSHLTYLPSPCMDDLDVWMMMEDGTWAMIFHSWLLLQGQLTRFLGINPKKGTTGNTIKIDKMFFEHDIGGLVSFQSIGVAVHAKFKTSWPCWKLIGLKPFAQTLHPLHQFDIIDQPI